MRFSPVHQKTRMLLRGVPDNLHNRILEILGKINGVESRGTRAGDLYVIVDKKVSRDQLMTFVAQKVLQPHGLARKVTLHFETAYSVSITFSKPLTSRKRHDYSAALARTPGVIWSEWSPTEKVVRLHLDRDLDSPFREKLRRVLSQ